VVFSWATSRIVFPFNRFVQNNLQQRAILLQSLMT
jgi:hypothetical protein